MMKHLRSFIQNQNEAFEETAATLVGHETRFTHARPVLLHPAADPAVPVRRFAAPSSMWQASFSPRMNIRSS
jgi:hypothetical protein